MLGGHDKGALFIDRAAGHWITRPFLYRKRLAREHRFVESGPAFHDRAINRHSLTRLDAKAVARAHEIKRDSALPAIINEVRCLGGKIEQGANGRSEEHTSELQSLMRISYAVFCLKKKQQKQHKPYTQPE